MLEIIKTELPECYTYIHSAYASSSLLLSDNHIISSEKCVQQGDPLGPLLFSLTIQPIIRQCKSDLHIAYLDDITLGGNTSVLNDDVNMIKAEALKIGLELNESKCELISKLNPVDVPVAFSLFTLIDPSEATLLGSPLSTSKAMDQTLEELINNFKAASDRLKLLTSHDALVILKHSLSIPSLLHNLRSSPCNGHPLLQVFDGELRKSLSSILNVDLDDNQWIQATLPVRSGGLGIRRSSQLAPSAYLSSAYGSADLVVSILPGSYLSIPDVTLEKALQDWHGQGGIIHPNIEEASKQRIWDNSIIAKNKEYLFSQASDDYTRARLLAVTSPHAGDWLKAQPLSSLGLRLDNNMIRVAVGLRLGSAIFSPHQCPCGASVDARGAHELSCIKSTRRQPRHALINDIIHRAMGRARISAVKEPLDLLPGTVMRPDGASLIPWSGGKCLAWDATIPDTLAPSHLPSTRALAGAAATQAATLKHHKYSSLSSSHIFIPISVETLGAWASESLKFVKELGIRVSAASGDRREPAFLLQRLSIAIQRGNAIAFNGSLPQKLLNSEDDNF